MGRKLNLTHLSDNECRKILDVIQRDFRVRHDEKERFTDLQKYVYEEAQKRMVLSRQQQFNEKHCICCFSSFGFILNRKIQCQVCKFFICKNCRAKSEKKEDILCIACVQQQELQVRACEWFYAQIRAKFRRFGSAKVVRSLYKRDRERGSGSEDEDSQNSDSGIGPQRSPDSLGSSFDLSAFMQGPRSDQETNTAAVSSLAILSNTSSPEYQDWLDLLRPPMSSVAVQAPHDKTDEDYSMEEIIQPCIATEDRCSAPDKCHCTSGRPDRSECSSPSLIVYDPHGDKVCKEKEKSEQVPPPVANGRAGDAMLFHILSPIEEMSSPEGSDRSKPGSPAIISNATNPVTLLGQDAANVIKECTLLNEDEQDAGGSHDNNEDEREEEESMISPRELDSGIHLAFSNSMDGDISGPCPDAIEADKMLSQRLKMQNIGCSDSFDSVSSTSFSLLSLDANDTLDSLETHIHSSHSDLHSPPPDIHDDFDSTNSTLTGKVENAEDDWKLSEADKTNLSRSSSEDTLKSDDEEEEGLGPRELSMEEFLDQIHTRTSSMTEEEGSKYEDENEEVEQDPSSKSFQDKEASSASREEESENRDHVSLNLEFHPRAFYKRSRSSDDFRTMRDEDQAEEPGSNSDGEDTKSKSKQHRNGKFASNRFIRYDSLPLVVEVYEADSNSPSFSPNDMSKSRFVYDSQDSESSNRGSPKRQIFSPSKSGKHNQPKKNKDIGQSRQTSVDSTTTESTLPKSTPISSGPTTPDFDCKRKNSHSTVSSESECSPDALRRDKILFTRQLLQQHKEYHQSEGIRPRTGHKMRSLSHSDADPAPHRHKGRMSNHAQLQKQLSLPRQSSMQDDEDEVLAGYRRLDHHDNASPSKAMSETGKSAFDIAKEKLEDEEEEGDDSCGCSNSDEITGLLSEQDIFDSEEEEEFEDANTTLTDDINGNGDSNHNDDVANIQQTDEARKVSSQLEEEKMKEQKEDSQSESFHACNEVQPSLSLHEPVQANKGHEDSIDTYNSGNKDDDDDDHTDKKNLHEDLEGCEVQSDTETNQVDGAQDSQGMPLVDGAEADDVDDKDDDEEREEMSSRMLRRKEEADLANLTYKLSIKQGEVLQSAEEVLSSANQLSHIQHEVDALDSILTSLERKVAKGVLSSQTSSEYEGSDAGDFDVSPQELVKGDLCDLEVQLSQTDDDNPESQINMATAVRMITATALKVLNTTEAAIGFQQDDTVLHAPLLDDNILLQQDEDEEKIEDREEDENEEYLDSSDDFANLSDLCDDIFAESEFSEEGHLKTVGDVLVDKDNNVFQCGLQACDDDDGMVSIEKDRNANAVHLSPKKRLCGGQFGSGLCQRSAVLGKVPRKRDAERNRRESRDGQDVIDAISRSASQKPTNKDEMIDLRERKGVPKESLRLTLPTPKPQEVDKKKQTGDRSATPNSAAASTKPKSPEATISPGSRHSPSSGPILHLTCGPTSPPTATLLFSSDELVWDSAGPVSSSDSESVVPTEMAPDEGKNPRDAARVEILDFTPSPSKRHKSAEVSVFESSFTPTNGASDFSPDFLSAFYDRVSELEERVYLSAGKVFTLEERLEQLEMEVNSVDCTLPDDIMAILEDKVALTVAQVQQCEREVHTVEDNIIGLDHTQDGIFSTMYSVDHIPSTPRKLENISSASFLLNHPALKLDPLGDLGLVQIEIPGDRRRLNSSASDGEVVASPLSSPGLAVDETNEGALTDMDGGVVVYTWGNITVTDVSPVEEQAP